VYNVTLAELVQCKPTTSMPTDIYADMIRDKIDSVAELEAELECLRGEIADYHDESDELDKVTGALRELIAAIDGAGVGKVCKVGALVVVEVRGDLAGRLGEALTAARALL
jgi:hypothetical protein